MSLKSLACCLVCMTGSRGALRSFRPCAFRHERNPPHCLQVQDPLLPIFGRNDCRWLIQFRMFLILTADAAVRLLQTCKFAGARSAPCLSAPRQNTPVTLTLLLFLRIRISFIHTLILFLQPCSRLACVHFSFTAGDALVVNGQSSASTLSFHTHMTCVAHRFTMMCIEHCPWVSVCLVLSDRVWVRFCVCGGRGGAA
jgi:hypothetical protein